MKHFLFGIFLLLSNISLVAQQHTISGEIINSETKSPVPFVNIGIENRATGTVSNSSGVFTLKLDGNVQPDDAITISHVGFETVKILYSQFTQRVNIIVLKPIQEELKEVVIKFVKPKPKKIGRSSKGLGLMHMNFYSFYEKDVEDRLSKEVGMKFKLKKDCRVNDFNFNITSNEFKSLKFRLNFYKLENGLPSRLLLDKDIIFEIRNGYLGWYKLDLKPYDIYLGKEAEDIAVTIQWVESIKMDDHSKYFGIATAMSASETSFFREKSMDTWKKKDQSLSFYLNASCK